MEDARSTASGGRSQGDASLVEYNRRLKHMQERLLLREYQGKLERNDLGKHQQQLSKQAEKHELEGVLQQHQQHALQIRKDRMHEQDVLSNQYEAMIAERNLKQAEERNRKLELENRIVERQQRQLQTQKEALQRKAEEFRKQVERDVAEKQRYRSAERQIAQATERSYKEAITDRARRELFYEEGQRKYFKQFNEAENRRLANNLQNVRDSLSTQLDSFEQQRLADLTDPNLDTQLRHHSDLRRQEQVEYRQGLDMQMLERQIRRNRERSYRSSHPEHEASVQAFNPILNPLQIERKNPNVMRMLQQELL